MKLFKFENDYKLCRARSILTFSTKLILLGISIELQLIVLIKGFLNLGTNTGRIIISELSYRFSTFNFFEKVALRFKEFHGLQEEQTIIRKNIQPQ